MIDLEIYTDKIAESGRRLIRKAYEEARSRDHNQLAPEHLFISITEVERPFFNDLVAFMTSGPVVVQVLEGEDAVKRNRDIMGATNPANAEEGTIRKVYAESIEANSVHGSDSDENAATEIAFFFKPEEIVG